MIPVRAYKDRKVAVFGLGRSGLVVAEALKAGGAHPVLSDDTPARCEDAKKAGFHVVAEGRFDWSEMAALVLSPGVPFTHPEPHGVVKAAGTAGVPVLGDIELFAKATADLPAHRVVAITGTNGKSTTTALVGHILKAADLPAAVGGNIGEPALALEPLPEGGIYVLELSSYQIDLIDRFVPDVAVLLNMSPDHLDRHGDMAGYAAAKERLFRDQGKGHTAVIGVDDAHGLRFAERLAGRGDLRVIPISGERRIAGGVAVEGGALSDQSSGDVATVGSIEKARGLRGAHNGQNAAAAYAVCRALGLPVDQIMAGLMSFPGLSHRMESVGRVGNVEFINDSKATNVDAASRALGSFDNIYWIAGGRPKTTDLSGLSAYFPRIRRAYLIGDAANDFARSLDGAVDHVIAGNLATAVTQAWADAQGSNAQGSNAEGKGPAVVLLSPACASFDQFTSFEARGDAFRAAVQAIVGGNTTKVVGGESA